MRSKSIFNILLHALAARAMSDNVVCGLVFI